MKQVYMQIGWVTHHKITELKGFSYDTLKNWRRKNLLQEGIHFQLRDKNYIYHFENIDSFLTDNN